jgi:protein TonB
VADGPGGRGSGNSGTGKGGNDSPLAGITIAAGPVNPGPVAVSGPASGATAVVKTPAATPNAFITALKPLRPADIARQTRPAGSIPNAPMVGDAVFGPKRYYSMTLNMPNLTSTGGSWIIRFAELNETPERGDLTAPVATLKVDPAYPPTLRRAGMEGVVVLYAVIHADGSVGDVRVLQGLDDRLDASARAALVQWRFRPATKNGNAVDLEAVVQIPFKAGHVNNR